MGTVTRLGPTLEKECTISAKSPEVSRRGLPRIPSRPEQAATALRELIISGELLPGQPLREEEYAKEYEIARNTVREAFQLLAHEGLVEHIPYRGVHIRRLGAADIRALYRTRRLIEPLGIQAVLADPEAEVRLRAVVDEAAEAAERGDWQGVGTGDIEFHRILVDACGSPHLSAMFEQLLAELRLAFLQLSDSRQLHQPYLARNRALLDLIGSGDTARLAEELADYLSAAEHDVLRDLDPES